jgi:hypothetical protein
MTTKAASWRYISKLKHRLRYHLAVVKPPLFLKKACVVGPAPTSRAGDEASSLNTARSMCLMFRKFYRSTQIDCMYTIMNDSRTFALVSAIERLMSIPKGGQALTRELRAPGPVAWCRSDPYARQTLQNYFWTACLVWCRAADAVPCGARRGGQRVDLAPWRRWRCVYWGVGVTDTLIINAVNGYV